MAGGLFNRLKVWLQQDNVYSLDLNGEVDNVINHLQPIYLDNYSHSVGEMQISKSPGTVGSEVLPTSLADELAAIRYMLSQVMGTSFWYSQPPATLSSITSLLNIGGLSPTSRIASGRISAFNQPLALQTVTNTATLKLLAAATNMVYFVNSSQATLAADLTSAALSLAPGVQNTASLVNAIGLGDTVMTLSAEGTNIDAAAGTWQSFKVGAEIIFAFVSSGTLLTSCMRGMFFDGSDANKAQQSAAGSATVTLLKTAWVFLTNSQTLAFTYNNPKYSYVAPTSPTTGDYWFDFTAGKWKSYSGSAWVDSLSVLVGMAAMDSAHCIATKTFDYYKAFSPLNTVQLNLQDTATLVSNSGNIHGGSFTNYGFPTAPGGAAVSVYGNYYQEKMGSQFSWSTVNSLDSGITIGNSTQYFCYITDLGDMKISNLFPIDRRFDLQGWYHPAKPWRCVGTFMTDGSANAIDTGAYPNIVKSSSATQSLNNSNTFTVITNLKATILTSGNPVDICLFPATAGSVSSVNASAASGAAPDAMIRIKRDGTEIAQWEIGSDGVSAAVAAVSFPAGGVRFTDTNAGPGIHVYTVEFKNAVASANTTVSVTNVLLQVAEQINVTWPGA